MRQSFIPRQIGSATLAFVAPARKLTFLRYTMTCILILIPDGLFATNPYEPPPEVGGKFFQHDACTIMFFDIPKGSLLNNIQLGEQLSSVTKNETIRFEEKAVLKRAPFIFKPKGPYIWFLSIDTREGQIIEEDDIVRALSKRIGPVQLQVLKTFKESMVSDVLNFGYDQSIQFGIHTLFFSPILSFTFYLWSPQLSDYVSPFLYIPFMSAILGMTALGFAYIVNALSYVKKYGSLNFLSQENPYLLKQRNGIFCQRVSREIRKITARFGDSHSRKIILVVGNFENWRRYYCRCHWH